MTPHDMGKLILTLQNNELFKDNITTPLLHESLTPRYPKAYRYGFYSLPNKNRINGGFLDKYLRHILMTTILWCLGQIMKIMM